MKESYNLLLDAVELPKAKPTQRITTFASGTFVPNPKASTHYHSNRNYDYSMRLELGDILKVPFAGGTGGLLINQIYKDTTGQYGVKGCRWYRINSPEKERWWADNPLLKEWISYTWELLPYSPSYILNNFSEVLSNETLQHLKRKI